MIALARRVRRLVLTLFVVSLLTFLLTSLLPGDPALQILGVDNATPEQIAAVRTELGLDDPLLVRYAKWLGDAVTGDLGRSFRTRESVVDAIGERLPVTLEVGALAMLVGVLVSIPLGIYSAYRANGAFDKVATATTFALVSVPNFMLALVLIYVFAVKLHWLPATGWHPLTDDPVRNLKGALLPTLSLAVGEIAAYTRLLRTDMIATLQEDFIAMARSKGLPTMRILFRHAFRPSSLSLVTVVGLNAGAVVGGTVVVETIFALPGVGRLLVESIYQRDVLMVQGVVLLLAAAYVIVNFFVDIAYSLLDPRIRYDQVGRS